MARGDRKLEVTILGDASSVERALRQTDSAVDRTQVKLAGFDKAFRSAGVAAGVAAEVTSKGFGLLEEAARAAGDAIFTYNADVESAEKRLAGLNKNAAVTAEQLKLARDEADKGHGTYLALADAIAGLAPAARTSGQSMATLLALAEQLAASNPEEGLKGAAFALREAASGDFTSVIERFNLSRVTINRLKAEGVPAIDAVRRAMQEQGIDEALVAKQAETFNAQHQIFIGTLQQLAAEGGKPLFDGAIQGLKGLNAALKTPASKTFVAELADELQIILTGNFFADLTIQGLKAFYLLTDGYNNFLKAVSGGKIEIKPEALAGFRKLITDQESAIRQDVRKAFGEPVAAELAGTAPGSPLAASAVAGYGAETIRQYVAGMGAERLDAVQKIAGVFGELFKDSAGKTDNAALGSAYVALGQALADLARTGEITDDTMRDLSATFGLNTGEVVKLVRAQGELDRALAGVTRAQSAHGAAQAGANAAIAAGETVLAGYTAKLDDATRAAEQHAAAHAGIVDALNREIAGIQRAADATARGYEDQTAALQGQLEGAQALAQAHADASAAAVAAAERDLASTRERAALHAGLLAAVLRGETAEYLAQAGEIDELTRKTAERWEAEIGGARRAAEGANSKVRDLTRAGNREDLDYLKRIQAARESGDERTARRLEREKAAADKKRQGAMELARAEAAVANDDLASAQERAEKEAKAIAAKDDQESKAAEKRLGEIRDRADAQAKADAAAVKGIQDAIAELGKRAAADARASRDRIAQINDEIARENARYSVIAAGDAAAKAALATLIGDRKTYWQQETTQLGNVVTGYAVAATNAQKIADAAKSTFEYVQKLYEIYRLNPPGSPGGPPLYAPGATPLRGPEATGTPDNPAVAPRPGAGGTGGGGGSLDPGTSAPPIGSAGGSSALRDAGAGAAVLRIDSITIHVGDGASGDPAAVGRAASDALLDTWHGIVRAGRAGRG